MATIDYPITIRENTSSPTKKLFGKASGAILSQASEHNTAHGDVDPGFFAAGEHFIVFGKPTPGGKPGEGALNDPTTLPPNAVFCF